MHRSYTRCSWKYRYCGYSTAYSFSFSVILILCSPEAQKISKSAINPPASENMAPLEFISCGNIFSIFIFFKNRYYRQIELKLFFLQAVFFKQFWTAGIRSYSTNFVIDIYHSFFSLIKFIRMSRSS